VHIENKMFKTPLRHCTHGCFQYLQNVESEMEYSTESIAVQNCEQGSVVDVTAVNNDANCYQQVLPASKTLPNYNPISFQMMSTLQDQTKRMCRMHEVEMKNVLYENMLMSGRFN
jgi:hypothetical protein